ncbi:MAG: exosortase C-terminal domain/associated protein EpsI [Desulforhopalus sp.]
MRSIKRRTLEQAFTEIGGWKAGPHISYGKEVVEGLALDDYLNRVFVKADKSVSLYIGYYLTAGKVGAAHDPLVCFPGQGWRVTERDRGKLEIDEEDGLDVKYSTMTVDRGDGTKLSVFYWFQANEFSNADTLSQKMTAMYQKFTGAPEDNAFVRLTCVIAEESGGECLETMLEFTKVFYPVFLDYIRH